MSEHPVTPTKLEMGNNNKILQCHLYSACSAWLEQPCSCSHRTLVQRLNHSLEISFLASLLPVVVKPFPWNVTPGITFTCKSKIRNIIRQLPLLRRNVGDFQQQIHLLTSACYNTGNTFRYLYIYCYFNLADRNINFVILKPVKETCLQLQTPTHIQKYKDRKQT